MFRILVVLLTMLVASCSKAPPSNIENICAIFKQYPDWYKDAYHVERQWHVPISVQMAIIHQESKFSSDARPARTKLLWVIPWSRPSTAYGYTQALKSTWEHYKSKRGGFFAARDDFGDGVDFIGWYANIAHKDAGIPRDDAYNQYLAYHEGVGGYKRKTYLKKPWLIKVAHKVSYRAKKYHSQLAYCEKSLSHSSWYKFW